MKRIFTFFSLLFCCAWLWAAIDMQAHMNSKEGYSKYTQYRSKQINYYTGDFTADALRALSDDALFGALNELMGNTCQLDQSSYTYNTLRSAYASVDKDLNGTGNIIGYYDGRSMSGTWDNGETWNREHTWPQAKGANKDIPMGHDMQSVRPTSTAVNSSRGDDAYGELATCSKCYDPDEVAINNANYEAKNLGTYRGDAARVILYDYVVYGEAGGHKNKLYNGNAQLLSKLGKSGVFESIPVLLKWHMNDPISLTEMVRNDGAQVYQGNRNPFIDYPELAIQMLKNANGVSTYNVSVAGAEMRPAYSLTLKDGFIAYVGKYAAKMTPASEVTVTGATYTYDNTTGRLTITKVTGPVTITVPSAEAIEMTADSQKAIKVIHNGQILILKNGKAYNTLGAVVDDIR